MGLSLRPQLVPQEFVFGVYFRVTKAPLREKDEYVTITAHHPDRPDIRVERRITKARLYPGGAVPPADQEQMAWSLWVQHDDAFGETFGNAPKTLAEARANKNRQARDWEPRDALIACLREIDSGRIKPDELIVLYHQTLEPTPTSDNIHDFNYYVSTTGLMHTMGLLTVGTKHIMEGSEP